MEVPAPEAETDRDDALRLAELEAIGQLPTVCLPDPPTRQRRMLIAFRQELVGRRVACQNRIRALDALAAADPRTALIGTIPGVGTRTAEAVAAHLGDPHRFASGKKVGAYAGLVPRQYRTCPVK